MIRFVVLAVILVLSGSTSAECRDENCMTKETKFFTTGHTFYYNEVFNIGTNWYIIFDYPSNNTNDTITFNFGNGISKVHNYDDSKVTDSISFSGSSFSEENLNLVLNIKINNQNELINEFNLSIDINKPPAEDLFYLWGGMTVFWVSIGAYVLYISSRLTQIRDK
tara:strand:- start:64 stop:561 length:498 start_codon:yes stop_codon:yes gene_type:complete